MNKSEEKDEKSWRGQTKHRNLTKVNKQPENEMRGKADEFSNAFPNFSVLNEEERFAFFEALTAARKNVEKRGVPTRERFGTVHDEYLKYYDRHEQEDNQVQSEEETSKLKSHSLLHGDSITPPLDRSSSPEPEKGIFDEGSHSPTLNLEHTSEVLRQESLVITEPKPREECESIIEQDTNEMVNLHQKMTKNEKEILESQTPSVTATKARATPRFDALNTEEKEIFFRILQEAHNTVLQNNPGRESDILSMNDIMRRYQGNPEVTSVFRALDEKEENVNLKVKITLTSGDNERLKNSKPQTLDKSENDIGTREQKSEDLQPEISREKLEEKQQEKLQEKPEKKNDNDEENFCIPDSSDSLKEQESFLDKSYNKHIKTNTEGQTPSEQKVTTKEQTPSKEKTTTKEQTPSKEKTTTKEQTPSKEKVTTDEKTPSKEKVAIERTPSKEKVAIERTPSKEKVAIERAPLKEKVAIERTPSKEKVAIKRAPSKEKVTTEEKTPSKEKVTTEKTLSKEKVRTEEKTPSKEKVTTEKTLSKEKVRTEEKTPLKEKVTTENMPSKEKLTTEEKTPSKEKVTKEEQTPLKEKVTKESWNKPATADGELKKEKMKNTDMKPAEAVMSRDSIMSKHGNNLDMDSTEKLLNDFLKAEQKTNEVKKTEKMPDKKERQNLETKEQKNDKRKIWRKIKNAKKLREKMKKKDENVEFDFALEKDSTDFVKCETKEDGEKTKDMEGSCRTGSSESECEECMSRNKRAEAQISSLLLEAVKKDSKEKELCSNEKESLKKEKSPEKNESELTVRQEEREYDETCSTEEKQTLSNSSSSSCSSLYTNYLNRELPRQFSVQNLNAESTEAVKSLVLESSVEKSIDDVTQRTSCAEEEEDTPRQVVPNFTTGKVMLVDDNVVDRIRKLIYYLDAKVQKDNHLEKEYMRLLVDYAEYLSRVLESLVSRKRRHQAQNTFTAAEARLQFDSEFESKNKKNNKKNSKLDPVTDIPRSVSAQDLRKYRTTIISKKPKVEKTKDHHLNNKETLSPVLSDSSSSSGSNGVSRFVPLYSGEKTKIVTTKIRTLQDLLQERAEFVEGSIADFKIVYHPEQDFVPIEKPVGVQLLADDEEEHLQQSSNKFFRKLLKCCTCGRKGTDDEEGIFENLKGEAVRVDVYDDKKRDPASATLNRSTMEVLKASERKKMIEQYYKTD